MKRKEFSRRDFMKGAAAGAVGLAAASVLGACSQDNGQTTVGVKAYLLEKGFLVLHFDNYYIHELQWEDGELKTSREEKEGHGYGLKSIRFAAEKYGGNMMSRAGDGKFVLTIAFPAPGQAAYLWRICRAMDKSSASGCPGAEAA